MMLGCDLITGRLGLWAQDRVRKTTTEALEEMLGFFLFL